METQQQTASTTETRKFLFDLAFDNGMNKKPIEREKPVPTYSQEQLDKEKQLSYENGLHDGQKAMMEDQQQYQNALLSQIAQSLGHVIETNASALRDQLTQAQEICLVIMKKIMPAYVEEHGLKEIETIAARVIGEVSREPRLVFRVNESMFDSISSKINEISSDQAYAGKIVILGDPEIGLSDCRIEWADGGIERDIKTIWEHVERVFSEVHSTEQIKDHNDDGNINNLATDSERAAEELSQTQVSSGELNDR